MPVLEVGLLAVHRIPDDHTIIFTLGLLLLGMPVLEVGLLAVHRIVKLFIIFCVKTSIVPMLIHENSGCICGIYSRHNPFNHHGCSRSCSGFEHLFALLFHCLHFCSKFLCMFIKVFQHLIHLAKAACHQTIPHHTDQVNW